MRLLHVNQKPLGGLFIFIFNFNFIYFLIFYEKHGFFLYLVCSLLYMFVNW
jgi:hypothetical protein